MRGRELVESMVALMNMPNAVGEMVRSLTDAELRRKPSQDEFSALEHVCHLRDIEREAYKVRIEKLLHEQDPFLSNFDGSRIAQERDYNSESLDASLAALADSRQSNMALFAGATDTDYNKSGRCEGVGPITLASLLLMMKAHDGEHLRELNDLIGRLQPQI